MVLRKLNLVHTFMFPSGTFHLVPLSVETVCPCVVVFFACNFVDYIHLFAQSLVDMVTNGVPQQ